jgi:steroid 5-alpha reductase family enzyme
VAGVYLVALAVALGAGALVGTGSPLLTVLAADVAATIVVFVASRATDNTSMYDAYWSAVPPVVVLFFVQVAEPGVPVLRQVLVVALVWAWAVRLTANWARGWPGIGHEDWRYGLARDNGRPYWLQSFFGFHLFPTLQVYLGCLPLYAAVSVGTIGIGVFDVVATVVTGGAIVLEMVADEQLRAFNRTKSPGDICTVGLWAWCRHPNYLGELSFWWGLWLFGLAADPAWWWTVVGPLAMTAMFVFASIPMIDARSAERRPAYAEHMARVPALVPRRPRPLDASEIFRP